MSSWLIAAIGCAYMAVAVDLWWRGQPALALTFFAYALGNVGLWFTAR